MPPVSPQGSRGGLITAVVIFTILFVTATIFAIYYAVQNGKTEERLATMTKTSAAIYGDVNSPAFIKAREQALSDPRLSERTVLAAMGRNNQDTAIAIMGAAAPTTQPAQAAIIAANDAIAKASHDVPDAHITPGTSLVDAMAALIKFAQNQQTLSAEAKAHQDEAVENAQKAIAKATQDLDDKAKQDAIAISNLVKEKDAREKEHQAYLELTKNNNGQIEGERKVFNERAAAQELVIADLNRKLDDSKKNYNALAIKLGNRRVNPAESVVRRSDGAILTVASDNIVYINLGLGDHIVPGLTFEVYAKDDGIPALGDGMRDTEMPTGVASIEVQTINASSSQCRVTKLQPGMRIATGDLIANLVYDRNTKYNFVVYGNFDLNQTGRANPADADAIKSLVVTWGGKIQKDINIDTDFVVMGKEPKVDDLTEEDKNDPFKVQLHNDQVTAQAQYQKIVGLALDLHIPIMNQNRFLYFSGFYDLATR